MSDYGQYSEQPPRRRRSTQVALVLLGTAGVIGAAAAIDAWRKSRDVEEPEPVPAPQPSPPPITPEQTYTNNDYTPGVGYYHAPYSAWYPYPYNYHDPARGYYAGGLWQAAPFILGMMSSRPSNDAVTAALAAQRARQLVEQQQRQQQQQQRSNSGFWSNFRSGGGSGSRTFSSRPTPAPSSKPSSGSHSIQRGGFGSSGHSSGGAS